MADFKPEVVGVVGAGRFGLTISMMLSHNVSVLLYTRSQDTVEQINHEHSYMGLALPRNIKAVNDIEYLCSQCKLIYPVLPSEVFRSVIQEFAPYLHPYHVLIHATKGFDLINADLDAFLPRIKRRNIRTMSELIREWTQVVRIGCLSGPNLSSEILRGLPAATVVASEYDEVIEMGYSTLSNPQFKIYASHDLIGTELAGALKNIIAIGAGMIAGLDLGKNAEAFFLTRGLREMFLIGKALGGNSRTFFGTAGVGDLIATATSPESRNFQFGYRLAQGKTKDEIESELNELTEGVRTVRIMYHLGNTYQLDIPIVEMLHAIIFHGLSIKKAIQYLMDYPYSSDVDFLYE